MAADETSVVSTAKTAATSDISILSTRPRGRLRRPHGVIDPIEMSDGVASLEADTTDGVAAANGADDIFLQRQQIFVLHFFGIPRHRLSAGLARPGPLPEIPEIDRKFAKIDPNLALDMSFFPGANSLERLP